MRYQIECAATALKPFADRRRCDQRASPVSSSPYGGRCLGPPRVLAGCSAIDLDGLERSNPEQAAATDQLRSAHFEDREGPISATGPLVGSDTDDACCLAGGVCRDLRCAGEMAVHGRLGSEGGIGGEMPCSQRLESQALVSMTCSSVVMSVCPRSVTR